MGDIVQANRLALTKGENDFFNIGTGSPTSVNTLYEKLSKLQKGAQKPTFAPARTGELERSLLQNEKAKKKLGWEPAVSIDQGLKETFQYFQAQKKPASK